MKDESGSAFPTHGSMGEVVQTGMTLRDYFAAKAMQGLLAMGPEIEGVGFKTEPRHLEALAGSAYRIADAMIKERGAGESATASKPK